MNLDELTPDQIAELEAQIKAKKKAAEDKQKGEKTAYKQLQHEFVEMFFPKLLSIADNLKTAKTELYDSSRSILDLKKEVFKMTDEELSEQKSHSFSNANFSKTITIGHNNIDDWDNETASIGVARVNRWLKEQVTENNKTFVGFVTNLLKPNSEGLLKANRVLELHNEAVNLGDAELIEAVELIKSSLRGKKTSTFVKAKFKNENGHDVWLQLSMSND